MFCLFCVVFAWFACFVAEEDEEEDEEEDDDDDDEEECSSSAPAVMDWNWNCLLGDEEKDMRELPKEFRPEKNKEK